MCIFSSNLPAWFYSSTFYWRKPNNAEIPSVFFCIRRFLEESDRYTNASSIPRNVFTTIFNMYLWNTQPQGTTGVSTFYHRAKISLIIKTKIFKTRFETKTPSAFNDIKLFPPRLGIVVWTWQNNRYHTMMESTKTVLKEDSPQMWW